MSEGGGTARAGVGNRAPFELAPFELVGRLGSSAPLVALDARGADGWASGPGPGRPTRSLLALAPERVFQGGAEAIAEATDWLAEQRARGAGRLDAIVVGTLGYELRHAFEPGPSAARPHPRPPVWLAGFRALYLHDGRSGRIVGGDPNARNELARALERVHECMPPAASDLAGPGLTSPGLTGPGTPVTSDAAYRRSVRRALRWIRAGDVYQVNLSRRLDWSGVRPAGLGALYAALTRAHGAPFSAFVNTGEEVVLSNSPERFLRVADERIETCPIKGTRPRGRTPGEDLALARALRCSEKDAAEHLMIVDLERNDLGRICEIGSVRVERLAELRSFGTVHHLVSAISGTLARPHSPLEILAATFPGGSITGAPKIRAMEIIDALEPVPRGLYTGSIGFFDALGGLDLSIAIRTAVARGGRLELHLGGGIVADSDPQSELLETEDKGRAFLSPLG